MEKNPESPEYRWFRAYLKNTVDVYVLLADEAQHLQNYLISCGKKLQELGATKAAEPLKEYIQNAKGDTFNWNNMRKSLR